MRSFRRTFLRASPGLLLPVVVMASTPLPAGFVELRDVVPGIVVELRYATAENFVGRPIEGYAQPRAVLTREAAAALAAVQAELMAEGFSLKVYDAYRPQRAVNHFVRWARDPEDTATKAAYYPDVPKTELFARGYIALESGHSRGSTVDVTLIRRRADGSWEALDMGTPYDFFSEVSWPASEAVTPAQRANRMRLRAVMLRHGWAPYEEEWWHFTLRDEPFPDTYFDVPLD